MKHKVRDVMTKKVVFVRNAAPFKELVALMDEYRVTALPVVTEDGRLVGIVSEADLLLKEEYGPSGGGGLRIRRKRDREKAGGLNASDVMTSPVVTTGPDASLSQAARLMHKHRVKRLPVVDDRGRVQGIVSRADLLKVFLRPDAEIRHEVVDDVIQRTLWIDPHTIGVRVQEGLVTLSGEVEQRSLIPIIVDLVAEVEGVVVVENRLRFRVDDTRSTWQPVGGWTVFAPGARALGRGA